MSISSSISGKRLTLLTLSTRIYFLDINQHQFPLKAAGHWPKIPVSIKINQFYGKSKATQMFFISSLQAMPVWAKAKIHIEKHELKMKSPWLRPWQKPPLLSKAEQKAWGSRNGHDQFGFQTRQTFSKKPPQRSSLATPLWVLTLFSCTGRVTPVITT